MYLPCDRVYQVCSGEVDADPNSDFMDLFVDFQVFSLKIFFSETDDLNFTKFGMQLPHDMVYQVCSGEADPDPNSDLLDQSMYFVQKSSSLKLQIRIPPNLVCRFFITRSTKFVQKKLIRTQMRTQIHNQNSDFLDQFLNFHVFD